MSQPSRFPNPVYLGRWGADKVHESIARLNALANPNWTGLSRYVDAGRDGLELNIRDFDLYASLNIRGDRLYFRRGFDEFHDMALVNGEKGTTALCHCSPNLCHCDVLVMALEHQLRAEGHEVFVPERFSKRRHLAVKTIAALSADLNLSRPSAGVNLMKPGTDLFLSKAQALVNPVNCVGFMGKGVALAFKEFYPEIVAPYQYACREGLIAPGDVFSVALDGPDCKYSLMVATKDHWRDPSQRNLIDACSKNLRNEAELLGIISISTPLIGAGLGGVDPVYVYRSLRRAFADSNIKVEVCVSEEHHNKISRALVRDVQFQIDRRELTESSDLVNDHSEGR